MRSLAATHGGTDYTTLVAADGGPSGILNVYDTRRPRGLFEDVQEFGSASNNLPRADPRWRGFTHAPEGNAVGWLRRTHALDKKEVELCDSMFYCLTNWLIVCFESTFDVHLSQSFLSNTSRYFLSLPKVAALRGHRSLARCVCMSTSGDVVASGSDDKTVRFWDLARPAAVEGHEDYPNRYGDVDDGVSGYHSGSGHGSGYGGQYGGNKKDGNDNHSAAYNSQFTSDSGAGGGGMSWLEDGSLSFGTAGGTWEHLHRGYANGRGSNGRGLGVWGGVGGCREVTAQQLLLPHSVLSISCDPEGRAVVATDLKGGVFCSVQDNCVAKRYNFMVQIFAALDIAIFVAFARVLAGSRFLSFISLACVLSTAFVVEPTNHRSSKADNGGGESTESDLNRSERERKTSPGEPHEGTDDDNDHSENDRNGDNSTHNPSESNLERGGDNESYLDGGSLLTESGGGRRAAKLGTLAGRPLCAAVSHDGYYTQMK